MSIDTCDDVLNEAQRLADAIERRRFLGLSVDVDELREDLEDLAASDIESTCDDCDELKRAFYEVEKAEALRRPDEMADALTELFSAVPGVRGGDAYQLANRIRSLFENPATDA